MTYVIGEPCIDVIDRACEPVCPVEAIYYEDDLPEKWQLCTEDNARFSTEPLPGRAEPLGSPGGAARLGPLGLDTELVTNYPAAENAEP